MTADTTALAREVRANTVRMTSWGKASHVASGLSIADILAVLYGSVLRVDPENPTWQQRDRFIMSKGHAAAALYATLSERGFFPKEWLKTFYQDGSALCGHVTTTGIPGVDHSTGSLGHGLSVATGMALAAKRDELGFKAFVLMSDGECDEGSIWEPAMFAAHHRLDNLVVIIDYNKYQSLDLVSETLALEPFADKWRAFGWNVIEVDGHDHEQLSSALGSAPAVSAKPTCVIAHTTKGKGVSFMEESVAWHYRSPSSDDVAAALIELGATS